MELFVAQDGKSAGPFDLRALAKQLNGGQVPPDAQVCDAHTPEHTWVPIMNFFNTVKFAGKIHYVINPKVTNQQLARTAMIRLGQQRTFLKKEDHSTTSIAPLSELKQKATDLPDANA